MDELVKNTAIVDGALVRAVTSLMPGESIERILDETRKVNLKRTLTMVKMRGYETVIHLVDELEAGGLSAEDIKTVLTWLGPDDPEAKTLVDSGLVNSVLKFVSEPDEPNTLKEGCCMRLKFGFLKLQTKSKSGKDP